MGRITDHIVIFTGKEIHLIKSPYATRFTMMQQAGMKNSDRDYTNRKATDKPRRKQEWLERQKAKRNA